MRHQAFVTWVLATAVCFSTLATAAPGTIPIRGQLLDGEGVPLAGTRDYVVQFYDAETDGTALGGELIGTATLSAEGLFSFSVTPPQEMLSSAAVWYAIAVDSDATPNGIDGNDWFADRAKVESVPFALQAGEVAHVDAATIANGSVGDMEFEALDGVSGDIQSQLDAKLEAVDIDATTAATATNTAGIAANTADIAMNTTAIAFNATDIATKADTSSVDATQATQDTAIGINAAAIATNAAGIATKADTSSVDATQATQDTAIGINAAAIATNAAGIATKADTSNVDATQATQDTTITMNTTSITANASAIATKADTSSVDATQATQDAAIASNTSDVSTNTTAIATNTTDIATKVGVTDVFPRVGSAYVLVTTTDNTATNGTNLLAAYTEAKALTPHSAVLSAANRAMVIVPPGKYDLGTGQLMLDAEFVDLVGLTTARNAQYIFGTSNGTGTGVLGQTADDVRIENLYVECTRASGTIANLSSDPAAYFPETGKPNTIVRNCEFKSSQITFAWPMRIAVEYAGTFMDCIAGDYGFGYIGTASGTFTNCTGGSYAFAGGSGGTASGTFIDCIGGNYSFGGSVSGSVASGTFTNCTGGNFAFGGSGSGSVASGTFTNCTGGTFVFGGSGTASGTFTDCVGSNFSFGGSGTASGTFTNCTGGIYSFANSTGDATGGKFYFCSGGASSFTTVGSPTVVHCVKDGVAYP